MDTHDPDNRFSPITSFGINIALALAAWLLFVLVIYVSYCAFESLRHGRLVLL